MKCAESGLDPIAEQNANKLKELATKWFDNKVVDALTGGNSRDFKRFYTDTLPHLDFDLSRLPNAKELKKLEKSMDRFFKTVKKEPSKFL